MFRAIVEKLFAQVQSVEIDPSLLEIPQDRSMGDFALPCFQFAKKLKKAPAVIAQEIADELLALPQPLSPKGEDVLAKIEALWPYINITLDAGRVAQQTIWDVVTQWDRYGAGDDKNRTMLVEWWSPNTHKMLHVGHLRNALVSESVCTIADFAGYKVIRTAYGWDIGAHVAKWIWFYINFTDQTYPNNPEEFGIWSGNIYQEATRKADEKAEQYKDEIHEIQRLLEQGDEKLLWIWKKTRDLSILWLKSAFEELWCEIERFYRESEVEQSGIDMVKKYLADDAISYVKKSEWAIVADLEEFDLWIFLLLKSNWTSLYSTKDIALAHLKESEYDFDISLYVVATEQNYHFEQLFKTLELTWYETSKLHHMWYEMVELPDGKMSSRKGTIIPYHTWRNNAVQKAMDLLKNRSLFVDKDDLANTIAFAALKFSILLQDTYKKIRLDMDSAVSFEWETGPYLQYTYARFASIVDLWSYDVNSAVRFNLLNQDSERLICLHLSEFPGIVQKSANEYKPSLIARYVLDLARMLNSYYQSTKILLEDDKYTTDSRVALVASSQQVLKIGLWLLWIEAPNQM